MAKKDGPARYLAKRIAAMEQFYAVLNKPPPHVPDKFPGWSEKHWPPVAAAFKAFKLNPHNPEMWKQLLFNFCDAHFGKRSGGAPRWNKLDLLLIGVIFEETKQANPGKSDEKIRELLPDDKRFRSLGPRPWGELRPVKRKRKVDRRTLATARRMLAEHNAALAENRLGDWFEEKISKR
jgi:hypothetical protein